MKHWSIWKNSFIDEPLGVEVNLPDIFNERAVLTALRKQTSVLTGIDNRAITVRKGKRDMIIIDLRIDSGNGFWSPELFILKRVRK